MADDTVETPPVLRIVPVDDFHLDGVEYEADKAADVPRLVAERMLLAGKAVPASGDAHDAFTELAEAAHGQVVPLTEEHDLPSKKQAVALGKDGAEPTEQTAPAEMTKAELEAHIDTLQIDRTGAKTKADLLTALDAGLQAKALAEAKAPADGEG